MNHLFGVMALLGAALVIFGLLAMLVVMAFSDDYQSMWHIKIMTVGLCAAALFGIAYVVTEPPSPLSRGIVSDKRHTVVTMMVMTGKVLVPVHTEVWELISAEGAHCSVAPNSYENYHTGDAVVCAWKPS